MSCSVRGVDLRQTRGNQRQTCAISTSLVQGSGDAMHRPEARIPPELPRNRLQGLPECSARRCLERTAEKLEPNPYLALR